MTKAEYKQKKLEFIQNEPHYREMCMTCQQPEFGCYCGEIQRFDPKIQFVILMHPIEQKRRIATGRMSHLTLENSELIIGEDFTHNDRVSQLATSQRHHAVILYPGARSQCLSHLTSEERRQIVPNDKALTVFVIDGTWATARKMVRKSLNLHHLPRVCFQPQAPSRFRVRKQPAPECFSTIEAIHQVIELMGESQGFVTALRQHDALLRVFDSMVEKQLQFIENVKHRPDRYRRSS